MCDAENTPNRLTYTCFEWRASATTASGFYGKCICFFSLYLQEQQISSRDCEVLFRIRNIHKDPRY
jgi:hypothetical protein